MAAPDMTPADAERLLRRPILPDLAKALAFGFSFLFLVMWVARVAQRRYHVAPLAVACIAFGLAYIVLAITKPSLYWDSDSAVRARLLHSATAVTRASIGLGLVLVVLGALGLLW